MNMPPRRPRGSAFVSDADDTRSDTDNGGAHRQPFRPLQPHRASRSPNRVLTPSKSTPPREIILTPRATPKPLKRKASSRLKRSATKVKSEPPEIDLSAVRPPSPSDDPLLLSGTRSARSPLLRARFTPEFSSSPLDSKCVGPPVALVARLSGRRLGAPRDSPGEVARALPLFYAPRTVERTSGAWSDSDDDEFNLTADYTGKYRILKVPTKSDPDPPKGEASERAEPWGRPVSPFPYTQILERSLPLSGFTEEGGGQDDVSDSMMPCEDPEMWEVATEPPPSDIEPSSPQSSPGNEFADLDDSFHVFDAVAESTQVHLPGEPQVVPDSDQTILEEQEEEEQIDRELSVAIDDGPDVPLTFSKAEKPIRPMVDESSDEEDDVEGEDIVKVTSEDPKAAARAVAILRMHDYDCVLAAQRKKRSSRSAKSMRKRRKTIENAGISKSYIGSEGRWWQIPQDGEISPGSRSLPLLEPWRDAEDYSASFTLSPLKVMTTRSESLLPPPSGEWTRDCWKCLDKCLVAERLAVAAARGPSPDLFADIGDISKDAVLDRFANQLGGESILAGLGPDWSRNNLLMRLDVLIKRQQSRRATRAPTCTRPDSLGVTEPCYGGLLQKAMALSRTAERYTTSESIASDTTVVFERHDTEKILPDLLNLDSSWRTVCLCDPIRTPSRTPEPRLPHPKGQVHLRHASLPQKSMIPVPVQPKRLVDLRHLSPVKGDGRGWWPATRRSSGSSVRDLVRQFESLQDK